MHRKLDVIHIHTDLKFIDETKRFEGNLFNNSVIFIGQDNHYNGIYKDSLISFSQSFEDLAHIVKMCSKFDLVVLYGLNKIKMQIANNLRSDVKIAWRFFGGEIYGKLGIELLSEKTQKAIYDKWLPWLVYKVSRIVITSYMIRVLRQYVFKSDIDFRTAKNKIDNFLGFSYEEYDEILQKGLRLPYFLKLPILGEPQTTLAIAMDEKQSSVKPLILLGNNKYSHNNLIDIIDLIEESKHHEDYIFRPIFSYGPESKYTQKVRQRVKDKNYYKMIEGLMTFSEFSQFYQSVSAIVFNHYRQAGLGNIFLAFENGVKVYLNTKNIIYRWLKNEGFIIFKIEEFVIDLEINNMQLPPESAAHNCNLMRQVASRENLTHFQKLLFSRLQKNFTPIAVNV
jgi:hypothetical protein